MNRELRSEFNLLFLNLKRPSYTKFDKQKTASIFQVATREFIFIIDVIYFLHSTKHYNLNKFEDEILFNKNIVKLGIQFI